MSTFQSPHSSGPQGSHGQPSGGHGAAGQAGYGPYQGGPSAGSHYAGGPYQGGYQGGPYQGTQYQGAPGQQPYKKPHLESFFNSVRSLNIYRGQPRWIGGVCQGLGARWGIDPLIIRLALVIIFFINGGFLLAYGLLWLFLPERQDGRIHVQQLLSGDLSAGLAGSLFCVLMGMSSDDIHVPVFVLNDGAYFSTNWWILLISIAPFVALVAWLISRSRSHRSSGQGPTPNAHPSMPYPPSPTGGPGSAPMGGNNGYQPNQPFGSAVPPTATMPMNGGAQAPIPAPSMDVTDWSQSTEPSEGEFNKISASGDGRENGEGDNDESDGFSDTSDGVDGSCSPTSDKDMPAYFAPYTSSVQGASAPSASDPYLGATSQSSAAFGAPYNGGVPQPYQPYTQQPYPLTPAPAAKVQAKAPSGRLWLLMLGLLFIGIALGSVAITGGLSTLGTIPIIFGGITLAVGIPLLIAALQHRRGSWMSGLAVFTLLCAIPTMLGAAVVPAKVWTAPLTYGTQQVNAFNGNYEFGVGDLHIEASDLDTSMPVTMNVSVVAGALTIHTRSDQSVRINVTQQLGELRLLSNEKWQGVDFLSDDGYYTSDPSSDESGTYLPNGDMHFTHIRRTNMAGLHQFTLASPSAGATTDLTINVTMTAGVVNINANDGITIWSGRQTDDVWVLYNWRIEGHDTVDSPQLPQGMTHAVITDEQAAACASVVKGNLVEPYEEYSEILEMTPGEKAEYDTCAAEVAKHNDLTKGIATYMPEGYNSVPGAPGYSEPAQPSTPDAPATPGQQVTPAPASSGQQAPGDQSTPSSENGN
ncbi:PspC domain-containing protein [Actinomyces vulturis]|uniref:PspC domain-containing protein n=1 Tax=Actinomyces vulturis TaxID=1857645 RepID=UPI000836554D|nr:PspC domain-containing protein [Actinomyces vulturis]